MVFCNAANGEGAMAKLGKYTLIGIFLATSAPAAFAQSGGMVAFKSDAELKQFLKKRQEADQSGPQSIPLPPLPVVYDTPPLPSPAPPPSAKIDAADKSIIVTGQRIEQTVQDVPVAVTAVSSEDLSKESITNTQEADVDEGGIVKVHGRHLVVLRRGRLFTVSLGDKSMRAIDSINAFAPGLNGNQAWYDEMLISGNRIIVIGYSYARTGTEINRFRINADGKLSYEDTHHLRSNDYYSSTNYASRLIGSRLIFYTPLEINTYAIDRGDEFLGGLPAMRKWDGNDQKKFDRVISATKIYAPAPIRNDRDASIDVLHSITSCDLAAPALKCDATAVLGSWSSTFYVSGRAVYIWSEKSLGGRDRNQRSLLYRMPLNGARPGAVQVWGGPIDQFSFREERKANALHVVVRAESKGNWMWRSMVSDGDAALLRLPLSEFGDGSRIARKRQYRPLVVKSADSYSFNNRFVGDYLIYSAGRYAADEQKQYVYAVPLNGAEHFRVAAPHGVDRIEVMGDDAVVIGNDEKARLGFSAIELRDDLAERGDTYFLDSAREGEERSHAFFYSPDPDSRGGVSGTLGLPVTRDLRDSRFARLLGNGSAITFLRRNNRRFSPAGDLEARVENARDDACEASCVDWYGNARPIFLAGRVFALMGYELVEGQMDDGKIKEVGRLDFTPIAKRAER
jgi:hypothetical protein